MPVACDYNFKEISQYFYNYGFVTNKQQRNNMLYFGYRLRKIGLVIMQPMLSVSCNNRAGLKGQCRNHIFGKDFGVEVLIDGKN